MTEPRAPRKARTFKRFVISELSAVDIPAQQGADIAVRKADEQLSDRIKDPSLSDEEKRKLAMKLNPNYGKAAPVLRLVASNLIRPRNDPIERAFLQVVRDELMAVGVPQKRASDLARRAITLKDRASRAEVERLTDKHFARWMDASDKFGKNGDMLAYFRDNPDKFREWKERRKAKKAKKLGKQFDFAADLERERNRMRISDRLKLRDPFKVGSKRHGEKSDPKLKLGLRWRFGEPRMDDPLARVRRFGKAASVLTRLATRFGRKVADEAEPVMHQPSAFWGVQSPIMRTPIRATPMDRVRMARPGDLRGSLAVAGRRVRDAAGTAAAMARVRQQANAIAMEARRLNASTPEGAAQLTRLRQRMASLKIQEGGQRGPWPLHEGIVRQFPNYFSKARQSDIFDRGGIREDYLRQLRAAEASLEAMGRGTPAEVKRAAAQAERDIVGHRKALSRLEFQLASMKAGRATVGMKLSTVGRSIRDVSQERHTIIGMGGIGPEGSRVKRWTKGPKLPGIAGRIVSAAVTGGLVGGAAGLAVNRAAAKGSGLRGLVRRLAGGKSGVQAAVGGAKIGGAAAASLQAIAETRRVIARYKSIIARNERMIREAKAIGKSFAKSDAQRALGMMQEIKRNHVRALANARRAGDRGAQRELQRIVAQADRHIAALSRKGTAGPPAMSAFVDPDIDLKGKLRGRAAQLYGGAVTRAQDAALKVSENVSGRKFLAAYNRSMGRDMAVANAALRVEAAGKRAADEASKWGRRIMGTAGAALGAYLDYKSPSPLPRTPEVPLPGGKRIPSVKVPVRTLGGAAAGTLAGHLGGKAGAWMFGPSPGKRLRRQTRRLEEAKPQKRKVFAPSALQQSRPSASRALVVSRGLGSGTPKAKLPGRLGALARAATALGSLRWRSKPAVPPAAKPAVAAKPFSAGGRSAGVGVPAKFQPARRGFFARLADRVRGGGDVINLGGTAGRKARRKIPKATLSGLGIGRKAPQPRKRTPLGPQLPKATETGRVVSVQKPAAQGRARAVSSGEKDAVVNALLRRNASGRLYNRARAATSRQELQAVIDDANRILRLRGPNRIVMRGFGKSLEPIVKSKFGSTRQNRELTRPFGSHRWTGDSAKGLTLSIGRYFAPGIGMAQGMGETALFAGDAAAEGIFGGAKAFLERRRRLGRKMRGMSALEQIRFRREGGALRFQ